MNYIVRFTDGSQSPLKVTGWDNEGNLIGVATRGDGYKRVCFLHKDALHACPADPWIERISRVDGEGTGGTYPLRLVKPA